MSRHIRLNSYHVKSIGHTRYSKDLGYADVNHLRCIFTRVSKYTNLNPMYMGVERYTCVLLS